MIRIIKRDQGEKPSEPSSNTTGKSQTLQFNFKGLQPTKSPGDKKNLDGCFIQQVSEQNS